MEKYHEIRSKAGGLIVLLPQDVAKLSFEQRQHINTLEQAMISQDISIPVFFSRYSDQFNSIIADISSSNDATPTTSGTATDEAERSSALSEIINSVSANGYQIVVTGAAHTPNKQSRIAILQGELAPPRHPGSSADQTGKLPLIIITAHLNTFGLTNVSVNSGRREKPPCPSLLLTANTTCPGSAAQR